MPGISEGSTDDDFVRVVLDRFIHRLRAEDNALIHHRQSFDEVLKQARLIVADTVARLGNPLPAAEPEPGEAELLSVEIGTTRAKSGVHPVESLRAAALLYEVALPVLLSQRSISADENAATVGVVLYQAVMDRLLPASLSYVDFLMDRLRASRQEERLRIARELHDRVGHSMALILQGLDLFRHHAASDPVQAGTKLDEALAALTEAMQTVQQMSSELRRSVDKTGVEAALRGYMRANVPSDVSATLYVRGDAKLLPPSVSEELYLILREATRNALRHAGASEIRLHMDIDDDLVVASVTDDGRGFRVQTGLAMPTGGLPSMMERAELLHGDLSVISRPHRGTTVRVTVPLDRRSL